MQDLRKVAAGPYNFVWCQQTVIRHQPLAIKANHADAQVLCHPPCISRESGSLFLSNRPGLLRDPGGRPTYADSYRPRATRGQAWAAVQIFLEELRVHLRADRTLLLKSDPFDAVQEIAAIYRHGSRL